MITFIRRYAASLVLTVVATIHCFQFALQDRSSWGTGCGFGMFSTVDYHGSRFYRVYLEKPDGQQAVRLPDSLKKPHLFARIIPSDANLDLLAQHYQQHLTAESKLTTRLASASQPNSPGTEIRPMDLADAVRIELWALRIDLPNRQLVVEPKNTVRKELRPGANR
ncbi:MAG: hypothetical protein KDA87_10480 [Planctomycetales bacterium]|nr:hypothetical protein [Planctomycetales bacterium]